MMMASLNNDNDTPNPSTLPVPPSIKPTSRARAYRIPNTSDAAAAGALAANANNDVADNDRGNTNNIGNSSSAAVPVPESFLWATREIAALDFLMNVPLKSEKDIVRAGLSGGRWHRHHSRQSMDANNASIDKNHLQFASAVEVIDEDNKSWLGSSANHRNLSSFDITRNSGIEEEATTTTGTGTESSIHTNVMSLISEHNKSHTAASAAGGSWWDKLILKDKRFFSAANQQAQRREQLELEEKELERPTDSPSFAMMNSTRNVNGAGGALYANNSAVASTPSSATAAGGVPGRRLDGREAIAVTIPKEFRCRPPPLRAVARQAEVGEWETRVAYGLQHDAKQKNPRPLEAHSNTTTQNALLDGRAFFSAKRSYPIAIFSTIKYEPKKEETLRRRKQLEELGGGGTQFILPERDWRGISYRALLPQADTQNKAFNRLLGSNTPPSEKKQRRIKAMSPRDHFDSSSSSGEDDNDTASLSSSDESGTRTYFPGFLDDPQMVQGRNRNVMMGDKVTGPIISSTIQFVKPSVLKADLNKQFRERFDQWEPPKSQRKYIGARVIDGVYTLIDPTETILEDVDDDHIGGRLRSGSVSAEHELETIRMPPSLTLSKIRSLKQQALVACVRARIEISTLALACIYFERLCLDCRVDKSNRRLSFAACLLLAAKVNESNSMIAYDRGVETKSDGSQLPSMTSWVKPNRKSGKIFESLIVFFTHDWSLPLKKLYDAEWIVFSALGFSLKAKPSEVAFHFKRLLRVLEWNPRSYLGSEMYRQWIESLAEESIQNERRKARHAAQIKRNERKLLQLQRKLHMQQLTEEVSSRSSRRSSTTISEGGASQHGNTPFRRHSLYSSTVSPGTASAMSTNSAESEKTDQDRLDSPGKLLLRKSKKADGRVALGILSRLAKGPKQVSHGKELDKLPKGERKVTASMKQSASVPNLSSLDSKTNEVSIDFHIHEGDNESCQSDYAEIEQEGLFL